MLPKYGWNFIRKFQEGERVRRQSHDKSQRAQRSNFEYNNQDEHAGTDTKTCNKDSSYFQTFYFHL